MFARHCLFIFSAISIVVIDQMTKLWIMAEFVLYEVKTVIPGFFNLVHIRNKGMAFGLFNKPDNSIPFYIITGISIILVIILTYWFLSEKPDSPAIKIGGGFILGGAAGNLIDRVRLGEVVDFLDFYIKTWHWPAFNVADSAINIGAAIIILFMIREKKFLTKSQD